MAAAPVGRRQAPISTTLGAADFSETEMNSEWKNVTDDEILNFMGTRDNPNTARYERILQKRMTDATSELNDKLVGLMQTIYRASQGLQEKSDQFFSLYTQISQSQGQQRRVIIILSIVVAVSTAAYTWITWQSVVAVREANEIQKQVLTLQKQFSAAQLLPSPVTQGALRGKPVPASDLPDQLAPNPAPNADERKSGAR